jgi:adenylate cyclase
MGELARPAGERRLGAIMFTDVVGFSSISSLDEAKALRLLEEHRKVMQSVFPKYGGTVVKTMGDGFLVEFPSAVRALDCAVEVQREIATFNSGRKKDEAIMVRIGIHVGDVVHSAGDILGDAVNVAARLQTVADPGGICVTRQVVDQVKGKVDHRMVSVGVRELKNIRYPVEVFKVDAYLGMKQPGESALDPMRVAVLPFTNMSPDPDDRYFADGMTEELISTVSKISELQVISRTSVMRYRDTTTQVGQIGQELSVGSVLEGSVRKSGTKVRITAQLIRVEGDRHVWSQSYDRDLNDVFAIQADIAEQVANSLRVQLLSNEKQSIRKEATSSTEAHSFYLKGRLHLHERTEEGTKKALSYFQKAVEIDPGFAVALSGIADAYNILSDYGWMSSEEALPKAKMFATTALNIDEGLAEAHASLGLCLANSWELDAGNGELKRAIEIKPNYGPAHHWHAVNLFYQRRYEESLASLERALALDPHSRVYNFIMANHKVISGEYDEALRRYAGLIEAYPDMSPVRFWRSTCYSVAGRMDEAIEEAKRYSEMEGGGSLTSTYSSSLHLARIYAVAGRKTEAEALLKQALAQAAEGHVSATNIGWVMLDLGQKEEGYKWLDKAFDAKDPSLLYFNGYPWARRHRHDPHYAAIESKFSFKSEPD